MNNIKQSKALGRLKRLKSARGIALTVLTDHSENQTYINLGLNEALENSDLSPQDQALVTQLVYGTIQRQYTLDFIISLLVKKPKKLENWLVQLLRMSLFQFYYLDRIPSHAIINEAVNIAKKVGHQGVSGLVNGVLRNAQRQMSELASIPWPENLEKTQAWQIKYSLDAWIIDQLRQQVGDDKTLSILESINEAPAISLRIQDHHLNRDDLIQKLAKEDIEAVASDLSPYGIRVLSGQPQHTEVFHEGLVTIQDESAMLPVEFLDVQADDQVYDACAAPGGKTMQIASYLDQGQVVAGDIYDHKLELMADNAWRLGVRDKVELINLDASLADKNLDHDSFDRILVDAPCSGLGLMRRKPDIKYGKTAETVSQLQDIQLDILNSVAPLLKSGGTLVYSTCTILSAENQDLVKKFLSQAPDFELSPIEDPKLKKTLNQGMVNIYPDDYGTDGFFIARLKKK